MAALTQVYLGISTFFAVKFFAIGIFMPFFPVVLASRGLNGAEISVILAVGPLARIAAGPWLGSLSDRFQHRKHGILLYAALGTVFIAPLPFADSFTTLLIVASLSALFTMSVLPAADALAIVASKRFSLQYGHLRLWGSFAFIAANFFAGWLLDVSGPDLVVWMIVATFAAIALAALALPEDGSKEAPARHALWSVPAVRLILADRPLAAALSASVLVQGAHAMLYGFGTIYWQSLGLTGLQIGGAWGLGVVAEVVLFGLAGRITRPHAGVLLILLGALAGMLRWGATPFADTLIPILLLQVLHGLTFGATHIGAMRMIGERIPDNHAGGALGLFTAATGLAMSAGFALSGWAYDLYQGHAFWLMAGFCLLALVVGLFGGLKRDRQQPA
ncbi:MAG: MFS transporter [Pseudomonadota bacterium]